MELFGGVVVSQESLLPQLLEAIRGQSRLDVASLEALVQKQWVRKRPNALLLPADTQIEGNLVLDNKEEDRNDWLKRKGIGWVVCFGNLHVQGNLLYRDSSPDFLLFVAGNLHACNLVKCGLFACVVGDLTLSGYGISQTEQGGLRIGGALDAAGYLNGMPQRDDHRGDELAGPVRAPLVSRETNPHSMLVWQAARFEPEVIMERQSQGLPIWKDNGVPKPNKKSADLPNPEVHPVQPQILGQYLPCSQALTTLQDAVEQRTLASNRSDAWFADKEKFFPAHFRKELKKHSGGVLMLPAGTRLVGDLLLEFDSAWCQNDEIVGIACMGDLHLSGDIVNLEEDYGPLLFVAGDLYANNLILGGAAVFVLGNLTAQGIVVGDYNHGITQVGDNITAEAVFLDDYHLNFGGEAMAPILDQQYLDDQNVREVLVAELFKGKQDDWPMKYDLWRLQRAGKPLFRPGSRPPNGALGLE